MPPLNALRAFEVAARLESFTLAAKDLGVSQGAVSRHISILEDYLGVQLFWRRHRNIGLTQAGEEYAASIAGAFDRIELSTRSIHRSKTELTLHVKLFPTLAMRWLVPRLGHFHGLHPDIDVQITTSLRPTRPGSEDTDVAFIYMPLSKSPDTAEGDSLDLLFEDFVVPVCSPDMDFSAGPITAPEDLLRYPMLHSLNRVEDWHKWYDAMGVKLDSPIKGLKFGTASLAYQGALDCAGVAMAQLEFVRADLTSGRLVAPITKCVRTGYGYFMAISERSLLRRPVQAFRNWLLDETELNRKKYVKNQECAARQVEEIRV